MQTISAEARIPKVGEIVTVNLKSNASYKKEIPDYRCRVIYSDNEEIVLLGIDNVLKKYVHDNAIHTQFEVKAKFACRQYDSLTYSSGNVSVPSKLDFREYEEKRLQESDSYDTTLGDGIYNTDLIKTNFDYWLAEKGDPTEEVKIDSKGREHKSIVYNTAFYVDEEGNVGEINIGAQLAIVPMIRIDIAHSDSWNDEVIFEWLNTKDLMPYIQKSNRVLDIIEGIEKDLSSEYYEQTGLEEIFDMIDEWEFTQYLCNRYNLDRYLKTETYLRARGNN